MTNTCALVRILKNNRNRQMYNKKQVLKELKELKNYLDIVALTRQN